LGFAARTLRGLDLDETAQYLAWTTDLFSDVDLGRYFPDLPLEQLHGTQLTAHGARSFMQSDYRVVLPDDLLVKMDIATMANSLEARSPLLDVPLAEFVWTLPDHWVFSRRETKPLLRALAARVLPLDVARAPKRGFEVPVARWLAHDLRETVGDLLLSSQSKVGELGNGAAITQLVEGTDDFSGNRAQTVWALLMLEIFLRDGC
ncbi:MAG: asparagine synthase-related protein, partial [Gemmatimonadales bacterium]